MPATDGPPGPEPERLPRRHVHKASGPGGYTTWSCWCETCGWSVRATGAAEAERAKDQAIAHRCPPVDGRPG